MRIGTKIAPKCKPQIGSYCTAFTLVKCIAWDMEFL